MPVMMKMPKSMKSHSKGGMCSMCGGGQCAYADGGEVEHHSPAGGSSNRAKGAARVRNEENQAGVHKSDSIYSPGSSRAGYSARATSEGEGFSAQAKKEHQRVLDESRSMPNPKLKGLAKGGMLEENVDMSMGVHKPKYKGHFESKAGNFSRLEKEYKDDADGDVNSPDHVRGEEYGHKAYAEHMRVRKENSEINPKLKGLAHGGRVNFDDGGEAQQSDWDRLKNIGSTVKAAFSDEAQAAPKPTGQNSQGASKLGQSWDQAQSKAKGGVIEEMEMDKDDDMDSEISEMLGDELCEAIESKDRKRIMESLEAAVLQILDKKHSED